MSPGQEQRGGKVLSRSRLAEGLRASSQLAVTEQGGKTQLVWEEPGAAQPCQGLVIPH